MIISIHQPNYIPWIGFFNKLINSDIFVVFDDVQYPRGKEFGNRNYICTNNGPVLLTVPVSKRSEFKLWNEIEVVNVTNWNDKHLKSIEFAYKKSPYFNEYFEFISEIYSTEYTKLLDLNVRFIKMVVDKLDIETKIVFSSELGGDTSLVGLEKILFIIDKLGGTKYISGTGAGSMRYIDETKFSEKNIELIWQKFVHPTYFQFNSKTFHPNMSILDLMFNCGKKSKEML